MISLSPSRRACACGEWRRRYLCVCMCLRQQQMREKRSWSECGESVVGDPWVWCTTRPARPSLSPPCPSFQSPSSSPPLCAVRCACRCVGGAQSAAPPFPALHLCVCVCVCVYVRAPRPHHLSCAAVPYPRPLILVPPPLPLHTVLHNATVFSLSLNTVSIPVPSSALLRSKTTLPNCFRH
jgi:hypothetical protein